MIEFKSTTTPKSERLLANTMGYPATWHVVRTVPHPALPVNTDKNKNNTFQDIIYAGDPEIADAYFNHTAAMKAAMKWVEGESMPFDDNGGQLLPVEEPDLGEGDEVEVYYDQDREWGKATIMEVIDYRDDVRFNVKYAADDATQTNVCFERIREIPKPAKKKSKKRKASTSPVAFATSPDATTSASSPMGGIDEDTMPLSALKSASQKAKKAKVKTTSPLPTLGIVVKTDYGKMGYIADTVELELASKMGLPEGWAAKIRPGSRFTFKNPDGTLKFTSKRAVFQHLGLSPPKHGYNPLKDDDNKGDGDGDGADTDTIGDKKGAANKNKNDNNIVIAEQDPEDDPPWRTGGNKYLGRRIQYTFLDGVTGKGTITGWISDIDVDREGNPGFVSEKTKEPACLFHVTMDSNCSIAAQDFEEYELEDILVESDEE
mmetsp:Transcript_22458/g.28342  ORF Transcript_22458/g.28342 Transcript_22458/m.28342 type:complete len:432 (-) Transcript_22458:51-1346(-)